MIQGKTKQCGEPWSIHMHNKCIHIQLPVQTAGANMCWYLNGLSIEKNKGGQIPISHHIPIPFSLACVNRRSLSTAQILCTHNIVSKENNSRSLKSMTTPSFTFCAWEYTAGKGIIYGVSLSLCLSLCFCINAQLLGGNPLEGEEEEERRLGGEWVKEMLMMEPFILFRP